MKLLNEDPQIIFKTKEYPTMSTGLPLLDQRLLGGFQRGSIIHFFGEPGAGKTTFAMQILCNILKQGWRAVWVDCNGAFSVNRFKKIIHKRSTLIKSLIYVRPISFRHQTNIIQQLQYHVDKVGIIVVDPITHFYRAERFKEGTQGYFQELISKQLGTLTGIAHLRKIPIIVINYGTINRQKELVPLVIQGFKRVERYRFCFKNKNNDEKGEYKEITIERAPNTFAQGSIFGFHINSTGIASLWLIKKRGTDQ